MYCQNSIECVTKYFAKFSRSVYSGDIRESVWLWEWLVGILNSYNHVATPYYKEYTMHTQHSIYPAETRILKNEILCTSSLLQSNTKWIINTKNNLLLWFPLSNNRCCRLSTFFYCSLKGQSHEIFDPRFFHQPTLPRSLIITLKYFRIRFRFCRDIREHLSTPRYTA
jgi:hypothetical protein